MKPSVDTPIAHSMLFERTPSIRGCKQMIEASTGLLAARQMIDRPKRATLQITRTASPRAISAMIGANLLTMPSFMSTCPRPPAGPGRQRLAAGLYDCVRVRYDGGGRART